ncbi:hypothetical protein L6164_017044 [Bauhinia variegata]|uniref:Uncharacterized protein n=1 Tax=Bauhinia variegata TaxID=167791 RepID=A0ACB9N6V1_BAUVA|nr:hypothetical protein L6164_017044 [Bauhinia variegata]
MLRRRNSRSSAVDISAIDEGSLIKAPPVEVVAGVLRLGLEDHMEPQSIIISDPIVRYMQPTTVLGGDPVPLDVELEGFRHSLDGILSTVDKLEKQVDEVEQFFKSKGNTQVNNSKGIMVLKNKGEKHLTGAKKQQQDASHREAVAAKRMPELMREFATILHQAIRTNGLAHFCNL